MNPLQPFTDIGRWLPVWQLVTYRRAIGSYAGTDELRAHIDGQIGRYMGGGTFRLSSPYLAEWLARRYQ